MYIIFSLSLYIYIYIYIAGPSGPARRNFLRQAAARCMETAPFEPATARMAQEALVLVFVSMCLCVYVSMCLCVYVSMCLCVYVSMCLCVCVFVSLCLCVFVSLCLCVFVSLCLCVSVSLCMKGTLLQRRRPVGKQAFRAPNQGLEPLG